MTIKIIEKKISKKELREIAKEVFGDMVKCTADIVQMRLAVGGELHMDSNELLIKTGSSQQDVWGFNIYPDMPEADLLEFNSLVNIKPRLGNRSANIMDEKVQKKIREVVKKFVTD